MEVKIAQFRQYSLDVNIYEFSLRYFGTFVDTVSRLEVGLHAMEMNGHRFRYRKRSVQLVRLIETEIY